MAGWPHATHTFHTFPACRGAGSMNPTDPTTRSQPDTSSSYGRSLLNRVQMGLSDSDARLTHVSELPARAARVTTWPSWVSPDVVAAFQQAGVHAPWSHQT